MFRTYLLHVNLYFSSSCIYLERPLQALSLIWDSGFGIIKQNRGKIRDWKYAREVGCQNNYRDYGIEEPYWGANIKLVGCLFCLPDNNFLILRTSAITNWRNMKHWKDTGKCPHENTIASLKKFPQLQQIPKLGTIFLYLDYVGLCMSRVDYVTGYQWNKNELWKWK